MSWGNSEMSKNSESSHQVSSILKVRKEKNFEASENLKNLGILRKKGKHEKGEDNEQVNFVDSSTWRPMQVTYRTLSAIASPIVSESEMCVLIT
jgi:hypothetical protein